ncbi:acyl carrier protein [Actinoplanes sp. NPDC049681]|uniref:acyl carrier protein n=1 Tax=Actinoplanes sp. NPDC049681 TaxID=3363905 RepID=UPI0037BB6725
MSTMYETLVDLLVTKFKVERDEIQPGITFEELEMDSLFMVELLLEVQTTTGVRISEDTATPRDTIEHAADMIEKQVAAAAAS